MSRLFIAEKPELARAIVDGLDGGEHKGSYFQCGNDRVTWCIGHMLELCEPGDFDERYKRWNIDDLPIHTPKKYKVKANTKKQLKSILTLINSAKIIVHAGDNDAEGQLIVDELLEFAENKKPVLRFITNDNNTKLVKKALLNMKDNKHYYSLYQAALARNIADQLFGFNMTRAYTVSAQKQGYNGILAVGRVQTPILGLVVNRDRANADHIKQSYYEVFANLIFKRESFSAKYKPNFEDYTDEKGRINDKNYAEKIANQCTGKEAIVLNVLSEKKDASPPLPYNMLKLQADSASAFNYKPDQVMKITQELREKYRLITYNGSDCQFLNEEQHIDAPSILSAISKTATEFSGIISKADVSIKSRAFNNKNVSAHHAIIPTECTANLKELDEPLRNVYLLIARRYIAQFYSKYRYIETNVEISVLDNVFLSKSIKVISQGWRSLFSSSVNDDEFINLDLSFLVEGETGECTESYSLNKETKPLPLYTVSTLLNDLTRVAKYVKNPEIKKLLIDKDKNIKGESGGIGTARTRDQIIKKLFDSGFLVEKGKNIISTEKAKDFFDALPHSMTSPDMTALWHEQQLMIESNDITCESFISELMTFIEEQVSNVKNSFSIKSDAFNCPSCETGFLIRRKKDKSFFWACNNFPDCKTVLPDIRNKPDYKSLDKVFCPECSSPIKRFKGKYGFFWPCGSCKNTFKDKNGKPLPKSKEKSDVTNYKCGACGSNLIKRVSNNKSVWYGCSKFPKCKQTYFDKNGKPNIY